MANDSSKPALTAGPFAGTLRQIKAGFIVALVTLPIAFSAGYVAYAPFGAAGAQIGVQAALYAAIFAGVTASLLGRSVAVITSPRAGIAAIQSQIAAALLLIPAFAGAPHLTLAVMAAALGFTGLFQLTLAFAGLERIARMIPYPVMAGFVNGVAFLILQKQVALIVDAPDLAQLWQKLLPPRSEQARLCSRSSSAPRCSWRRGSFRACRVSLQRCSSAPPPTMRSARLPRGSISDRRWTGLRFRPIRRCSISVARWPASRRCPPTRWPSSCCRR